VVENRVSQVSSYRTSPIIQIAALVLAAIMLGVPAGQNGSPIRGALVAGLVLTVGGALIAVDHRRRGGSTRTWGEWIRRQPFLLRLAFVAASMGLFFGGLAGLKSGSWQAATLFGLANAAMWGAMVGWANRPSRTR